MPLSTEQIKVLVGLISTTLPDGIDCDECLGQIGPFAESALQGRDIPDGMEVIQRHLEQCPCCKGEYEALLDALRELGDIA